MCTVGLPYMWVCALLCRTLTHLMSCLYGTHTLYVLKDDLTHFIPYFYQSNLMMGDLKIQKPQSLATFDTFIPFKDLCSTHGVVMKGLFKHFVSLGNSFLNVKKMMQFLCSLRPAIIGLL